MEFLGTVYHENSSFFRSGRQRIDYYRAGDMLEGREFHAGPPVPEDVWRCIGIAPEAMVEIRRLIRGLHGTDPCVSENDAYLAGYVDELNTLLSDGDYTFVYAKIDIAEADSPTRTVRLYPPAFPCPFPGGWEGVYRDHVEQIIEIDSDSDLDSAVWGEVFAA